jgi:hypothetical protein
MAAPRSLESRDLVRPQAPQQKRCPKCGNIKPFSDFNKNKARTDGLQGYCRICNSDVCRDWLQANPDRLSRLYDLRDARRAAAQAFVKAYLQIHPCVDCGEEDWMVLEFDHVREEKVAHISHLVRDGSLAKLKVEVRKCDVRCANCHRRVTYQRCGSWRLV